VAIIAGVALAVLANLGFALNVRWWFGRRPHLRIDLFVLGSVACLLGLILSFLAAAGLPSSSDGPLLSALAMAVCGLGIGVDPGLCFSPLSALVHRVLSPGPASEHVATTQPVPVAALSVSLRFRIAWLAVCLANGIAAVWGLFLAERL